MIDNQKTIEKRAKLSGIGLHTGHQVTMVFHPAPANHGVKFKRVDVEGQPVIDADVFKVTDVSRGTTLEDNGVKVATVEHTLAALTGLGIDNVMIELDGPEVPILDGSSKQQIIALRTAGLKDLGDKKKIHHLKKRLVYKDESKGIELIAEPADVFKVSVMIDYETDLLNEQHASLDNLSDFSDQIASCRTFCFFNELEALHQANLVKGGDLENAIVFADKNTSVDKLKHVAGLFNKEVVEVKEGGYLNNIDLKFENEPARHKLLDVIGDLSLVGTSIRAHIIAKRPGHKANVEFAKIIKTAMKETKKMEMAPTFDPNVEPVFDSTEITKLLPHRYPFLLVDKIIEISENHIVGLKNVTRNEEFFNGHFPGNPVMPGVLQIEAMAQTGGIMILNTVPDPENYDTYFLKIDKTRFKAKVVPGDTLLFKLELLGPVRRGIVEMSGKAYVGNKVVSEAYLMAQIVKRSDA
jgi:UDP-3-O-[3-hydroxymyristoyl] N-acetylglucosamine deacetylase/3-hydroxyacyl-[acyl-carrier-protein] dehydratase